MDFNSIKKNIEGNYSVKEAVKRINEMELWKNWVDNDKHPTHFQPLYEGFKPVLSNTVKQYSRNPSIPVSSIEAEVAKNFLHACNTYDPKHGAQLSTWVHDSLRKTRRFVDTYSNSGKIPEPRIMMINHYKAVQDRLHEEHGVPPSLPEVVAQMNIERHDMEKIPVTVKEITNLQTELSRKDLSESNQLEEASTYSTPQEINAIMALHYSTPLKPGEKHDYRLTSEESQIFKASFPLSDDGTLDFSKALKPGQMAAKFHLSSPKISRVLKGLNVKIKKVTNFQRS